MRIPNLQPNTKGFVFLFFFIQILSGTVFAAGETAANFLKIGVGARGAAMADAQSAIADDVTSLYWNPAGLSQMRFREVSVMHYSLVESVRYNHVSVGLPTEKKGTFSFGANLLDYGDIDGFDNSALPTGTVDASNLLLSAAWSKKLLKKSDVAFGATFKYLQSELAGFKASAPMLDVGFQAPFKSERLSGLTLALTLRNVGPGIEFDNESSDLPTQLIFGSGLNALGGNLNVALDLIKPREEDAYVAAGLEYRVFKLLKLRAGYNGISDFVGNSITYGLGLHFNQWNLDYAFVPFGELGDTNRVSVNVRFGRAIQIKSAEDQIDLSYQRAKRQLALGRSVAAYSTVIDTLLIAPWHQPSVELKDKIEKRFSEMETSKSKAKMDAEIAREFTKAKTAFDRDELVAAKNGFTTILSLQPDHVGARVYLDRIKNRYASLAHESFKLGMDAFAAGDYEQAKLLFEKTLTIDEYHVDARAQLDRTNELLADRTKRIEEIKRLAGAADAYRDGLKYYQDQKWEKALEKFQEVQSLSPEYEEVNRYYNLTVVTLSDALFEEAKRHVENGEIKTAVDKLRRAAALTPDEARIASALKVAERDLEIQNARESQRLYKEGLEAYLGGRTEKAETLWNRALELDPRNEDALKSLTKLQEQKAFENENE